MLPTDDFSSMPRQRRRAGEWRGRRNAVSFASESGESLLQYQLDQLFAVRTRRGDSPTRFTQ